MIVVVTGGRAFGNGPGGQAQADYLCRTLDSIHEEFGIDILVQGDADGADRHARLWAQSRRIVSVNYPAQETRGKAAGPIRNREMLRFADSLRIFGGAKLALVAFRGGDGTADCVAQARALKIEIFDHREVLF